MPKSKSKGVGKRRTGGPKKGTKPNKQKSRANFESRHFDQVWEDVRKQVSVVSSSDGTRFGPIGTTERVELDVDLPARGQNYCVYCSRYFVSAIVQAEHERTKNHKRRVKALKGPKPHNQHDADAAGGLGRPDNGPRLRPDPNAKPVPRMEDVIKGLEKM